MLSKDRLQINHDAVKLLEDVTKVSPAPAWDDLLEDHKRTERLKVEVTMLRTNHEKDMKWFRSGFDLKRMLDALVENECYPEYEDEHLADLM